MTDNEVEALRARAQLYVSRNVDYITLSPSSLLELLDDLDDARDVGLSNEVRIHELEDEHRRLTAQVDDLEVALDEARAPRGEYA